MRVVVGLVFDDEDAPSFLLYPLGDLEQPVRRGVGGGKEAHAVRQLGDEGVGGEDVVVGDNLDDVAPPLAKLLMQHPGHLVQIMTV